jgi:hypothetical protein
MRTKSILLGLTFVLICPSVSGQWVQTNGLDGGYIQCFAVAGTNLFAGTRGGGVFCSTDNGGTWAAVDSGLTNLNVYSLAVSGTYLFAGTYGGVFLSTNGGARWTAVNNGLTDFHVYALAVSGMNLFAGTGDAGYNNELAAGHGVFLSTNNGTSWTKVNTGLMDTSVYAFAVDSNGAGGTNLFAGTNGGVFLSTNNGTNWTPASTGLKYVRSLSVFPHEASGTHLFAGMLTLGAGVFLSTNNGTSWAKVGLGLASYVPALAVSGTSLFAGTCQYLKAGPPIGVLLSTNNFAGWIAVNEGLPPEYPGDSTGYLDIRCLAIAGQNLFAGTSDGVWRRPLSEMITSVEPVTSDLPHEFVLQQNYPNPFNPSTTIKFELPKASGVRLSVFDMLGREVSVLVNERRDAGAYDVKVDGTSLASGMYFYRLHAGDFTQTKRILLLR